MTGFARARRPLGDGEVIVRVKTVNHRGLDIHIHAHSTVDPFENAIRTMIKSRISRGHADVRVSLPDFGKGASTSLNHDLLEQYLAAFQEAAARHNLNTQPDLNAALRLPGMFGNGVTTDAPPETETVLLDALSEIGRAHV